VLQIFVRLPPIANTNVSAVAAIEKNFMQKPNFQTLAIFLLGLIVGICIRLSFTIFLAMLFATGSVFIYTMQDAEELKKNQDKYFLIISSLLYLASVLLSIYLTTALILFISYEFSQKRNFKTTILRLIPFVIITLISLVMQHT
jgi:hypothetical protein